MKNFILNFIENVAQQAGLPEARLMTKSATDNITLLQPRLEYEFLPEKIKRSGKKLGITRGEDKQTTKKELYLISQDVKLTLFSENEDFRTDFCRRFLVHMPKGENDKHGNYLKIIANNFEMVDAPVKRVGDEIISIFESYDAILSLNFTYRITTKYTENLITKINIQPPVMSKKQTKTDKRSLL